MATTTMTLKSQKITVSGTSEHDINFDAVLFYDDSDGNAFITMVSGTAVQFSPNGQAITADSLTLSASGNNTKEIFEVKRGVPLRYKGGAGSEVFNINIVSK